MNVWVVTVDNGSENDEGEWMMNVSVSAVFSTEEAAEAFAKSVWSSEVTCHKLDRNWN